MKKGMYVLFIIVLTVSSCKKNELKSPRQEFAKMSWILGSWEGRDSNSVYFEKWKQTNIELFDGLATVTIKGDTVFSEQVTIEVIDSVIVYRVVIGKNEPVLFKLISADEQLISFSNPLHDFPQNITYQLKPDGSLYAYVDGMINKQYRKDEFFYNRKK